MRVGKGEEKLFDFRLVLRRRCRSLVQKLVTKLLPSDSIKTKNQMQTQLKFVQQLKTVPAIDCFYNTKTKNTTALLVRVLLSGYLKWFHFILFT